MILRSELAQAFGLNRRIDVYVRLDGRWVFADFTRQYRTLTAAATAMRSLYQEPIQVRWSEPKL